MARTSFILPWRGIAIGVAALIAALVISVLIIRVLAATSIGRDFAESRIEALFVRGQSVEISGLSGDLFSRIQIADLVVSDAEGGWLYATNVTLEWSPWAIVQRRADISDVSAQRVVMERRPTLERSSGGGESFIQQYRIEEIRFPDIRTSAEVTRAAAQFAADGRLRFGGRVGALEFRLTPENAEGDRVDVALEWSPNAPLSGRADGEGPAGGLIAQLLQLDEDGAPRFELTAERANNVTEFRAELDVSGEKVAELEGRLSSETAAAEGEIDLRALPSLRAYSDRIGPQLLFDVSASGGALDARLETDILVAQFTAPFDVDRLDFEDGVIDVSLETSRLDQLLGRNDFTAAQTAVKGRATQERGEWIFVGDIAASELDAAGVLATRLSGPLTLAYDPADETASGGVRLTFAEAAFPSSGLSAAAGASPELALDFLYEVNEADLSITNGRAGLAIGDLRATGRLDLAADAIDFSGRYDLAGMTEMIGSPVDAAVGDWTVERQGEAIEVRLGGRIDELAGAESLVASIINGGVDYTVEARLEAGEISAAVFDVSGEGLVAEGRLETRDAQIDGVLTAALEGRALDGLSFDDVELVGELKGSSDRPAYKLTANSRALSIGAETLSAIEVGVEGRMEPDRVSGNAAFNAEWRGEPGQARSAFTVGAGGWTLDALDAVWAGLRASGDAVGAGSGAPRGAFVLSIEPGSPLARAGEGVISFGDGAWMAQAEFGGVSTASLDVEKADIDLSGAGGAVIGDANLAGFVDLGGVGRPARLDVGLNADTGAQAAVVEFDFTVEEQTLRSLDPVRLNWADGQVALQGTLDVFGGRADILLNERAETGDASIVWRDVPAQAIGVIYGRPQLVGVFGGDMSISHLGGAPTGRMIADISGLGDVSEPARADGTLSAELSRGRVAVASSLASPDVLDFKLSASAPVLSESHPYALSLNDRGAGVFELDAAGRIETLWNLVGPARMKLAGDLNASSAFAGPVRDFLPVGAFSLSDAEFEDRETGFVLKNMSLAGAVSPDFIEIEKFKAGGGRGGSISGAGLYRFDGVAEIELTLDRLNALRRSDALAVVSGDVSLGRRSGGPVLAGALRVDEARLTSQALPQQGYQTLDVRFVRNTRTTAEADVGASPLALDLTVQADRQIFVSGPAFDTEWALDLEIVGRLDDPVLSGRADIVRGDLDFVGRRFVFSDSAILFEGAPEMARLQLRAEYEADALTAVINVAGAPDAPEIDLTSQPDLPQDEVLSHIMFGESAAGFGALQAAQLSAAAASLSSGDLGYDFTGALKDSLGVDRLDFGTSADGSAALRAGQYVAPDVYVELQSNTRGAPGWGVEWTPWRSLQVGAEREAEDAPRFTVRWRRDFDFDRPQIEDDETEDADGSE